MIRLSSSIADLFYNNKKTPMFFIGKLQEDWKKIVGTHIGLATSPFKIENNKLYIKCKNPTWKTEINFQKTEILKKINKNKKYKIREIILL